MKSKTTSIFLYGVAITVIMILLSVISYVLNLNESTLWGVVTYIFFILSVFFAQRFHRNNTYDGIASLKNLFKDSFFMILIFVGLHSIYNYIFLTLIAPETVEQAIILAKQKLFEVEGLSETQLEYSWEWTKKFMTPTVMTISSLLTFLLWGSIFALISAAINKKKINEYQEVMDSIENN